MTKILNNFLPKMTVRRTSLNLIETAISEGWIKQLAFFHMLKFRFNNSCIYNYHSRMDELAKEFDICPKTLYGYLKILRSKNMVFDHSRNLILTSIRDFRTNRKKSVLLICESHNLFDITCLLYGKLIEQKAKNLAFNESVRRFGRGNRYYGNPCENPFRPSLSYRTLAKIWNVSECKAFNIIKNLCRLDVVKTVKQKPHLISKSFTDLKSVADLPGYKFVIGTKLFRQFGNRIEFLQFPVYLKRITIRQYKQLINNHL